MTSPLVVDCRGQTAGVGPARIGTLNGGFFFSQIGPNVADGGFDPGRANNVVCRNLARRFRGQLFASTSRSGGADSKINVYDEGGTNAWQVAATAKGALGVNTLALGSQPPNLYAITTPSQDYLVGLVEDNTTFQDYWRYNPDNGVNGTWTVHQAASAFGGPAQTLMGFVHDGLLHTCSDYGAAGGAVVLKSFDPISGGVTQYTSPFSQSTWHTGVFFTLYDRLFFAQCSSENVFLPTTYTSRIAEFSLGSWTEDTSINTRLGNSGLGANVVAIPLSVGKVLLIGPGIARPNEGNNGVIAVLVETIGSNPTAGLQVTDVSNPVIPAAIRSPDGNTASATHRIFAYTNTADALGTKKFFLYFHPDGTGSVTPSTLFEVTDESTEMAAQTGTVQADSDFGFPEVFYGGGETENGIDQSTRLVTASARGWAAGVTGLVVNVGAHGDPTVLAYHNLVGGPWTVGETITGGTSGATATLVGDGAAEGLYLRDVTGTFLPDEQITGGSSGATADLNEVLPHGAVTSGPFQVGETVTGGTSGATGTITHLGLGGAGEQLVKVEWTSSPTQFSAGEVITGGTSGASATLSSAPLGSWGGGADKTIRARYFYDAAGPSGKGVPITGYCTMVAGSGFKGTVSKGTGPGGSDELTNVVADGSVGGDSPASFEWDFLTDGVPQFLVTSLVFEIDRT
jgi:hypothetical protein